MKKFIRQSEAQRFILRMVPQGYFKYLFGIAKSLSDLEHLHTKYAEFYGCDLTPAQRSYRKSKGLANTHFISAPAANEELEGGYHWYLLISDGDGPIAQNAKVKDVRLPHSHIIWNDYVLRKAPRPRELGGGERWSWYLNEQTKKELDHHVGVLLKGEPSGLKGFFEAQCKRPMHFGVRNFIARLITRAEHNFSRMYPGRTWPARDPKQPLPIISSYKKDKTIIDE